MKKGYVKPFFLVVPCASDNSIKASALTDNELSVFYQEWKSQEETRSFVQNPNIIERQIGDEWLLVPTGDFAQHWNGMISLNEIAHFIWSLFKEPTSLKQALLKARESFNDPNNALEHEVRSFVYEYYFNRLLFEVKDSC